MANTNNQKIPCGGFYLDASLKLTDDNKLGVAGGGIYNLKINSEQIGSGTWKYSIAEDSQLKTYDEIVKCIENGNAIRCNQNKLALFTSLEFEEDDRAVIRGGSVNFWEQDTARLTDVIIIINKDSTIKAVTQRFMDIPRSKVTN